MGAPLKGRTFTLVGEFSLYQFEVKNLIIEYGGEVIDYVPPGQIQNTTVLVGAKTNINALGQNKKYSYLVGSGAREMTENELENLLRKDDSVAAVLEERRTEDAQAMLEQSQHYGEW